MAKEDEKMTREDAIDFLKANYPDSCYELLREAVDIAIESLEQPEIIKCKDCCFLLSVKKSEVGVKICCGVFNRKIFVHMQR